MINKKLGILVLFVATIMSLGFAHPEDNKVKKEIKTDLVELAIEKNKIKEDVSLKEKIEQEKKESAITYTKMYVSSSIGINIRNGASLDSEIIYKVTVNTELQVEDNFVLDGWKRVKFEDQELYAHGDYLSTEQVEIRQEVISQSYKDSNNRQVMDSSGGGYLGVFKITHYAPTGNLTSTGTVPSIGRTIAVDPRVIPYGSTVIINGHAYIAEDCGGAIKGNVIDIFVASTDEAYENGVYYTDVFIQ